MRRTLVGSGLAFGLMLVATAAAAHDFWLQPQGFRVPVGAVVPLTIEVGHGKDRQQWASNLDRVLTFKELGPPGARDLKGALRLDPTKGAGATLRFDRPGTRLLVFQSAPAESNLPALRFNDYAKLEGLTPVLDERARNRTTETPGREIYSRRAKALVLVGAPDAATDRQATSPVGLTLEIVPERNPYTLKPGELLPVRVLYEGRPLPGALVKLTSLEFDAKPIATHLTDAAGRASFEVPRTGEWLVNVIWSKRITGNPKADFDTTFSSLTFGYSQRAASRPATN